MNLEKMAANTDRVHSVITIKAVDDEKREFVGIASTPATDRMDDIVEPAGAQYKLPISLLWQHDRMLPVGTIVTAKATKAGIEVRGSIPKVDAPLGLAARLEEAWQSLKHELVRGLSIGFRAIEYSFMDNGGIHFTKWEWLELSLVTIPANAEATITSIKSFDQKLLAASGHKQPVVARLEVPAGASANKTKTISAPKPQEGRPMNIEEQIKGFEATRQAKDEEMKTIMSKSAETGETLDAEQAESYDSLKAEVKSLDEHLDRLRAMREESKEKAKPVEDQSGMKTRAPAVVASIKNEEKGILFARHALCIFAAKGNTQMAAEIAKNHYGEKSPVTKAFMAAGGRSIESVMKAAVAGATTTDATWAGPLVAYNTYAGDFVEFLRPKTIIGQFGVGNIPALRRVPFNVHIKGQTSGGNGYWVGQGAPKPVTKFDFNDTYHGWFKVAGISVATDEMIRFSDPAIEVLVRDGLAGALSQRMNTDFVDYTFAGSANVSPASIFYGATAVPSSGNDADAIRADIVALEETGDAADNSLDEAVLIMHPRTARKVGAMTNALGQLEFPGLTKSGGVLMGNPVITSTSVPYDSSGAIVGMVNASDVWYSDDGQATVDFSNQASIQMLDNPTNNSATGTATTLVSMFQTDSTAFRAHRFANWSRRRESGVAYLTGVNWGDA